MIVLSFNILYGRARTGEHAWSQRRDLVASVIRFHRPDLLGLQEALDFQIDDLAAALPEYGWIGAGRDDGRTAGEYAAIFYRKARFELLDQGTFWLSETPERPSLGWDADCIRIATWGRFRERANGRLLCHLNTHFDHRGEQARMESAHLLLLRLASIAGGAPVVVTGDLNDVPASPMAQILTADGSRLGNTHTLTAHHGPGWTYHGFDPSPANPNRACIDYILADEAFTVCRHGHLVDHWDGRYPSDHLPVLAEFAMADEA
jgi:endonuclease/exonuclease/phosphatase family metal-dependent hydrolase